MHFIELDLNCIYDFLELILQIIFCYKSLGERAPARRSKTKVQKKWLEYNACPRQGILFISYASLDVQHEFIWVLRKCNSYHTIRSFYE